MKQILFSSNDSCSSISAEDTPWYQEVSYPCSYDNSQQKALVCFSESETPRPLVVVLHTWSFNYQNAPSYAAPALEHDFHIIMPDFRGSNSIGNPEAMGSDAAVSDIVDAVKWMQFQTNVDKKRIYLLGGSGGGHMALLMAGRHPDIWAGISVWCPISDLTAWCDFHNGKDYGKHIIKTINGDPRTDKTAAAEAARRSPLTYLANAKNVNLDISTGIHDGCNGSVPISETLYAFNKVAGPSGSIPEEHIASLLNEHRAPEGTPEITDPGYGERKIHYRKISGNTRVTIFEGGHNIIAAYGFNWLANQKKGTPAVWKNFANEGNALNLTK